MATAIVSKPSTWLSNKTVKLSLPHRRSKCEAASSSPSSPPAPKNGRKEEDQFREVFSRFDVDGDGKISSEELRTYFASIGENMSREEAQGAIRDLDTDGDDLLDLQDFMRLMKRGGGGDEDLRTAFEMFEMEKGSGCITPKGLQKMLSRLGEKRSYEECVAMIRTFDLDGNGVLDYHEFQKMMS